MKAYSKYLRNIKIEQTYTQNVQTEQKIIIIESWNIHNMSWQENRVKNLRFVCYLDDEKNLHPIRASKMFIKLLTTKPNWMTFTLFF